MMTPARIKSAAGASAYYGKDDYYVTGEAGAPGIEWGGKGASALGLEGLAKTADFHDVLGGKNPHPEGPALTAAAGKDKHHPGWDFTFTVPKSVSLAIAAAERFDPELAQRLNTHVLAANRAMMAYIEDNHAFTRVRGEAGEIRQVQTGNLVYASVMHRTTRSGDPHIHVHNPTANTTRNPETGAWGALETRHIYRWQQVASQVGARELQAGLMQEGFNIQRHGELKWEIAAVDPKLIAAFSQRSAEIEAKSQDLAAQRGVTKVTHHQRNMVQKQTRKNKEHHDREALLDGWIARAAALGGGSLESLLDRDAGPGRDATPTLQGRMNATLQGVTQRFRAFTRQRRHDQGDQAAGRDLDREAHNHMAFGVAVVEEQNAVNSRHLALLHALRASPAGLTYGRLDRALGRMISEGRVLKADKTLHAGITTQRTIDAEREIVAAVQAGKGTRPAIVGPADMPAVLARTPGAERLNEDQRGAVAGFFTSRDRYRAVPGFAGAGKTFAFGVVRQVAEGRAERLLGLSSFNTHVQEFRTGSGIPAQTVASWLLSAERDIAAGGERLAARAAVMKKTHLIVDEASTLTNDSGVRLVRAVETLGVKSVTIAGDTGQTGGPGAGNVFKAVLDRGIAQFPLKIILRQRGAEAHLQGGVKDLAEGRLKAGMLKLAPHIHALGAEATDLQLAHKAVDLWTSKRAAGLQSVLITATNRMRAVQSGLARQVLKAEGQITGPDETRERLSHRPLTRAEQFRAASYELGDTVIFNSAFKGEGPRRADRAVIIGIDLQNNILKLKGGAASPSQIDLDREHARGSASFSSYSAGVHEIAKGERLVWEARFKNRGYDRGAAFTIKEKGAKIWTLEHADGRVEKIRASDPVLSFTSYGYAMTTERAQGQTIEAPIATMSAREGQAVAETKNYVNWSRLTKIAEMVTDDAPKVLRMLAQNDGQKPVALDHIQDLWEKARTTAAAKDRSEVNSKDHELDLNPTMDKAADGPELERQRTRTRTIDLGRSGPGL